MTKLTELENKRQLLASVTSKANSDATATNSKLLTTNSGATTKNTTRRSNTQKRWKSFTRI